MRAGQLRHWVSVQKPVTLQDESGEVIVDQWTEVFADWASVEPLKGKEFLAASEFRADITNRIRIRYRDGVTETMRVVWENTIYNIVAVLHVNTTRREIHLMCTSGMIDQGGNP